MNCPKSGCPGKLFTLLHTFFSWRWYRCEKCSKVFRSKR